MKFTLTITLGNIAMLDGTDLADALRKVAGKLAGCPAQAGDGGPIRDDNGNTVGEWEITGEVEAQ